MATFKDLKYDWSMLCQECTECWTQSDLQLAAELGKTLLERNKELENSLKSHQTTIEEQAQEIEYMKKQTAALREVNNSRLKIYEQLEVSIQDLERANRRLVVENSSDKKLIKSQGLTIESLETKSEDLHKKIDDLKAQCDSLQRQQSTIQVSNNEPQSLATWKASVSHNGSIKQIAARSPPKSSQNTPVDASTRQLGSTLVDDEEVTELLRQLHDSRNQRAREQARVTELSEQLTTLINENAALEDQLSVWRNKAQDMKNLQDEINTLEEVRQGHLCGRCLRGVDLSTHDELSVMLDQEEDDDISMAESFVNDSQRDSESSIQDTSGKVCEVDGADPNPYRVLVEKYEALLEVQRHPAIRRKPSLPTAALSLQEELEMSGEFNNFQNPTGDYENNHESRHSNQNGGRRCFVKKPFSATPTDFSEAETSSSGFSDETSNKSTQTDERPGSFLCSIADGENCKFSIYDDNSSFESRFRKTPEYRELFSEIFDLLKRAAEAKDVGEELPLLDNSSTHKNSTNHRQNGNGDSPQDELNSEATDDCQSVMSSVISSVVSEPVFRVHTPTPEATNNEKNDRTLQNSPSTMKNRDTTSTPNNGRVNELQTRNNQQPRRHQLDYLSINVQVRKKNASKKNSMKKMPIERSTTPENVTSPRLPKSNSGGRRNKCRPLTSTEQADGTIWNGNTLHIFSSKTRNSSGTGNNLPELKSRHSAGSCSRNGGSNERHNKSLEYKEYKPSTASEEVARLRRLEMSYAEALRMPNKPKVQSNRRY